MASRIFNGKKSLEREVKELYAKITAGTAPTAVANLTADITYTSVRQDSTRNTNTITLEVEAAAANPTDTVLVDITGTSAATVITVTPNNGLNNPDAAATATLNLTADIILTSVAAGTPRNTQTFTTQVLAAAPNPTDTVLVTFAGTAAAITCTITPNDGTNNAATPVDLTTAELVELINTGLVAGKTITLTDASSRRVLQTATGGDATALADAGEGDGVVGTFTGGTDTAVDLTTAELVELINSGTVAGKTVTLTDASSLRALQTATGGDATALADAGEGDEVVATFSGGVAPSIATGHGFSSIALNSTGDYTLTLSDRYNSLKMCRAKLLSSTATDIRFQLKAETVATDKTISFYTLTGATKTNPPAGSTIVLKMDLKNAAGY